MGYCTEHSRQQAKNRKSYQKSFFVLNFKSIAGFFGDFCQEVIATRLQLLTKLRPLRV